MARPVKSRGRPTASSPSTSEALNQASGLLAAPPEADIASQFDAAAAETPGGALALIDALGASRDEAAGRVLTALAQAAPAKEQRKAARRALHRLRSAGIAVAVPVAAPAEPSLPAIQDTLRPTQAMVTAPDGVGSRLLWLLFERPRSGSLVLFNLAINDVVGLKDVLIDDTTR